MEVVDLRHNVVRAPSAVAAATDEGVLVLDMESGHYFALDEVGEFVWERLDGTADLAAVVQTIVEEFEVERERAESDLLQFVSELVEAGLVRLVPS